MQNALQIFWRERKGLHLVGEGACVPFLVIEALEILQVRHRPGVPEAVDLVLLHRQDQCRTIPVAALVADLADPYLNPIAEVHAILSSSICP